MKRILSICLWLSMAGSVASAMQNRIDLTNEPGSKKQKIELSSKILANKDLLFYIFSFHMSSPEEAKQIMTLSKDIWNYIEAQRITNCGGIENHPKMSYIETLLNIKMDPSTKCDRGIERLRVMLPSDICLKKTNYGHVLLWLAGQVESSNEAMTSVERLLKTYSIQYGKRPFDTPQSKLLFILDSSETNSVTMILMAKHKKRLDDDDDNNDDDDDENSFKLKTTYFSNNKSWETLLETCYMPLGLFTNAFSREEESDVLVSVTNLLDMEISPNGPMFKKKHNDISKRDLLVLDKTKDFSHDIKNSFNIMDDKSNKNRYEYGTTDYKELCRKNPLYIFTPLQASIIKNMPNVMEALIKAGANINLPTVGNLTPLMVAAYRGKTAIVKRLLNLGASITPKHETTGQTALDMAIEKEYEKTTQIITEHMINSMSKEDMIKAFFLQQKNGTGFLNLLKK